MNVRRLILLVTGFSSFLCTAISAQEPAKVVEQYVRAVGGSGRLSKLRTLTLQGAVASASNASTDGEPGTFTLDVKSPNRYYLELRSGQRAEIFAYNGKSAWGLSSPDAPATLLGPDALQLEATAVLAATHLRDLKKNKIVVAYVGTAKISGRDAIELEFTTAVNAKRRYFFDATSHLLLRESGEIRGAPLTLTYDDYRPENGIAVPHKIRIQRGDAVHEIVIDRVAVNEPIGERVFDFPRKSQVQLPDLKKLFAEIEANQKALDKLRENYTGRKASEETEYDGSGRISKVTREEHTFFYLNGEEVSTLVAKDGKPLSAADQEKENEKTRKRIEEIQKSQAKKEKEREKAREEGKESKDGDEPGISSFLRACQFINPRRERFRGIDVLVFDFEGNPEYKPKNIVEHVAQELAGAIWVDEAQHEVVRLEAHLVKNFNLAGGLLASLQQGTSFTFEQAFVNNEVWLPTYEEAHVGARAFLLKGFRLGEITRYSDYQRFSVDTLSTIIKPKTEPAANEKQP